jgi:photosystem II stability/assembly factor-like uncharacterized protein
VSKRWELGACLLICAIPVALLFRASSGSSIEMRIRLAPTTTTIPAAAPAAGTADALAPPSSIPTATGPATSAAPVKAQVWTPVTGNLAGLSSDCGNVGLGFRPDQDMVIAGIAKQGLFSATPGSDQWSPLGAAGGDAVNNRISQILVDPANPQTFWEAGIYGDGVFRTDDNGATFRSLGVQHIDSVSVDFSDPARRTLLAGKHESGTVFRSSDGGAHWDELSGLPADVGNTSWPYVVDANTYLVGSFSGPGSGVFRSTDAGATWTKVFDKAVNGTPVVRDGKIQWLQDGGSAVITSTDGGATWTSVSTGGFVKATAMIGLPDGSLASWNGKQIALSGDGGTTWRFVGARMPYEPTGIAWSTGANTFYAFRADCERQGDNPPKADSILRLDDA